jgi:hypothetical protein
MTHPFEEGPLLHISETESPWGTQEHLRSRALTQYAELVRKQPPKHKNKDDNYNQEDSRNLALFRGRSPL